MFTQSSRTVLVRSPGSRQYMQHSSFNDIAKELWEVAALCENSYLSTWENESTKSLKITVRGDQLLFGYSIKFINLNFGLNDQTPVLSCELDLFADVEPFSFPSSSREHVHGLHYVFAVP